MKDEQYSAIIAAAGEGRRFGKDEKLKEKLSGKSVLSQSLDRFDEDDACIQVIVAASQRVREWIAGDPLTFASGKLKVIAGGESRIESVQKALTEAQAPIVVIQDGSRPNWNNALLQRVLSAVKPEIGAVPGIALKDPPAYVTAIGETESSNGDTATDDFFGARADHRVGHVMEHPDPSGLYILQTPQAYYRESLEKALKAAKEDLADYADYSALYIGGGFEVAVVPGLLGNLKLVTSDDMAHLNRLMGGGARKKKDKYGGLGW